MKQFYFEQGFAPISELLESWMESDDVATRKTKEIAYELSVGKDFPSYRKMSNGVKVVNIDEFHEWSTNIPTGSILNDKAGNNEVNSGSAPDWKLYALLPHLTSNECASILEGVDPKKYRTSHHQDSIAEYFENDLSDEIVRRVDLKRELIDRCEGQGLSPVGKSEYYVGGFQNSYYADDFISWANSLGLSLPDEFLANQINFQRKELSQSSNFESPEYLDKNHPCYSPKLAAAIEA